MIGTPMPCANDADINHKILLDYRLLSQFRLYMIMTKKALIKIKNSFSEEILFKLKSLFPCVECM